MQGELSTHINLFLALLLIVSATAVIVKWVRMPYAVALVITGLAIGLSRVFPPVSMTPDLVLLIFLPALLFEASWNLDVKALRRDWLAISVLATGGVVVCMLAVAAVLTILGRMDWQTSLLFGAMVSATDPISVIAVFRKLNMSKRLTMILEGESLFNDGTAVVLFKIVLAMSVAGSQFAIATGIGQFLLVVCGGLLLGSACGYVASRVTKAFDDHLLEITLTTITAYGSYLAAEQLHLSTVMSVVAAGIVLGNYGSRTGMSPTTRLAVNSFWEYAAFLVNSLLFLLIGLHIEIPRLLHSANVIGLGILSVLLSRALIVYGLCPFVSTKPLPIPAKWRHLLFWGGLRGALVMALALSLPLDFPHRTELLNMTFGVVLFTLLVPGLTIEPLVKLLGMAPKPVAGDKAKEYESLKKAYRSELMMLTRLREQGQISKRSYDSWKEDLESQITEVDFLLHKTELTRLSVDEEKDREAKAILLKTRKESLLELSHSGDLHIDRARELAGYVDELLEDLERSQHKTCKD